jgi:sugar fermentation stimulation protein A
MADLIYHYPNLYSGVLLKRYKRFFADVQLDSGEIVTAHCPNTGPMTGICQIAQPVLLSRSDSKTRKLPYTWEMIQVEVDATATWVGVNTSLPNRVMQQLLQHHLLPDLGSYDQIRQEVPYGREKSRIDFLLQGGDRPIYLEVKNTTWSEGPLARFPDTVTTRGQKHLREMMGLVPEARAVMVYFINRGDCDRFAPGDTKDPHYGELLRQALQAGVEVLPCRFEVTPGGLRYLGLADLML